MNPIINTKVYTEGMRKSLIDKVFFVDKVECKNFVDFGCGDGSMIDFLAGMFPENNYYGYDENKDFIDSNIHIMANEYFSSSWDDVFYKLDVRETGIILSSVVHEVYSYKSKKEIEDFWNIVYNNNFGYVIFRDMMVSSNSDRPSDVNDVLKIRRNYDPSMLSEFESNWGSITHNKNLIHFLLKYRYKENWSREVEEDYLPIYYEKFLSLVPSEYDVLFLEHYSLPFLKTKAKSDFDIDIKDNTHIKMILKRKDF